jgi:hypothetical protein
VICDAFSIAEYRAERWLGKDLEGGGCGPVFEVLSQLLTEGTEKNEQLSQDNRYPGRDSKRGPPEYKYTALPLEQRIR